MQALTEIASDCAERVSAAPKGDAARCAILWKEQMVKHLPNLQGLVNFYFTTVGRCIYPATRSQFLEIIFAVYDNNLQGHSLCPNPSWVT